MFMDRFWKTFMSNGNRQLLSLLMVSFIVMHSTDIDFELLTEDLSNAPWFAVISVLQNTLGSALGKEVGHIWVRTKVWRVNVRNLEKIQDKWLLFQRFVKSIVASTPLKIKKISVQPRRANSALQAKLRPLSYSLLEPFEHNLDQKSSIKRLLQPTHASVVVYPNNSNEPLSGRMTTHAMAVHLQANYSSA